MTEYDEKLKNIFKEELKSYIKFYKNHSKNEIKEEFLKTFNDNNIFDIPDYEKYLDIVTKNAVFFDNENDFFKKVLETYYGSIIDTALNEV